MARDEISQIIDANPPFILRESVKSRPGYTQFQFVFPCGAWCFYWLDDRFEKSLGDTRDTFLVHQARNHFRRKLEEVRRNERGY